MDPFRTDPLNPFGNVPGDPMEEVLALQSYSLGDGSISADCLSSVSCNSGVSCKSELSARGGADEPVGVEPLG